jgi:pimeloyl-ACP methyl ester carboxylesterase
MQYARLMFIILGVFLSQSTHAYALCPKDADPTRWIDGGKYCLAMRLAGRIDGGKAKKLVVLIHGDVSAGGPADYMYKRAGAFGNDETIAVALIRPGYEGSKRSISQGSHNNRRDNYTPTNIDAIADAILRLKKRYGVTRTIVVGHSGGAAITGVMLGRHPGIADGAVLVSCPCNIPEWRLQRGRKSQWRSLSPHTFVDRIPSASSIIAITGNKDDNTSPDLGKSYVNMLRKRGIDASFLSVAGGAHGFEKLWPTAQDAVKRLLVN